MEKLKAAGNFKKICIIRAIRSGMFSISIIMLFFAQNGVSLKEAITLQSLFSLASIAFELPTGHFADKRGRKLSIILGGVFSTLGFSLYAVSYGFFGFLLAETILALGMSFISGADSALLLDTQKEACHDGHCISLEGKSRSWGMLSESLTSLIGGTVLAAISLRLPIYFDAIFSSLVIWVALTLEEPNEKTIVERRSILFEMWRVMKYSLHDHKEVKSFIWFSAIAGAATLNMVWLTQSYWELTKIPVSFFGIGWSALLMLGAMISYRAHRIENWIGKKASIILILVSAVAGYFFLGTTAFVWSSIFLIPFYIPRGLNDPIMRGYINSHIPEKDRATIFSAKSLMTRLIFSIIGPIVGVISESFSLQTAILASGIVFGILGVLSLMQLARHKVI